jgi:hypothetical protein
MGPLILILLVVAAWDVTKSAVRHAQNDYGHSRDAKVKKAEKEAGGSLPKPKRSAIVRRHRAGYFAGELLHGFPVTRTGLHAGWIAHRTARAHAKAIREEARTTDTEVRASVLKGLREHEKRRREAFEDIEKNITWDDTAPVRRKEVDRAAKEADVLPFRPRKAAAPPLPADGVGEPKAKPGPYAPKGDAAPQSSVTHHDHSLVLSGQCPECHGPGPGIPLVRGDRVTVGIDGTEHDATVTAVSGDVATARLGDGTIVTGPAVPKLLPGKPASPEPSAEPPSGHGPKPSPAMPTAFMTEGELEHYRETGKFVPGKKPSPASNGTPTQGGTPVSDTTFTTVVADAKAAHAQADEDITTIRKRKEDAYAAADAMTGANVDPAVIDAQMSYADSLGRAETALTEAGEHAGNTATSAEKFHGGMQEAHDSAPGQVAEKSFHEGA